MEETRNLYKILVRKPEGKRPRGTFGCRWEDVTAMDITGVDASGSG